MKIRPRKMAARTAFVNVLVERNPRDLKLGYLTVLTIIADKNKSTSARRYFQFPRLRSLMLNCMISKVREATNPAADGIGNPRNSLLDPPLLMALRQLKRARRKAPQSR